MRIGLLTTRNRCITLALALAAAFLACDDKATNPTPESVWEVSFLTLDDAIRDMWFAEWTVGYAVGRSRLYNWDGWIWEEYGDFAAAHPGWTADFAAVAAPAPDDVWVVGTAAGDGQTRHVFHYDGHAWETVDVPGLTAARDVYFLSPDNGWVAGNGIYHYNGQRWEKTLGAEIKRLRFTVPEEGYACGEKAVYRWNGDAWVRQTVDLAPDEIINGVACRDGAGAWAVGSTPSTGKGFVFQFNGGPWERLTAPPAAVACADLRNFSEAWAAGRGVSWHYDGHAFTPFLLPSAELKLTSLWMADAALVWACGSEGPGGKSYILRFRGFE